MLTAKQARKRMTNRKAQKLRNRLLDDYYKRLFKRIKFLALHGKTEVYSDIPCRYKEEVKNKLQELGYTLRELEIGTTVISWEEA